MAGLGAMLFECVKDEGLSTHGGHSIHEGVTGMPGAGMEPGFGTDSSSVGYEGSTYHCMH